MSYRLPLEARERLTGASAATSLLSALAAHSVPAQVVRMCADTGRRARGGLFAAEPAGSRARRLRWLALGALAGSASACSGQGDDPRAADEPEIAPEITEEADFIAGGSIEQVWVTDAKEGDELILVDSDSVEVGSAKADRLGSVIWRDIAPGDDYTVRHVDGNDVLGTDPFRVLDRTDEPDAELYEQELDVGLNYVAMRDGIELAMTVRLPADVTLDDGPFPTVVEYSGYQVAAPGDLFAAAVGAVGSGGGLEGLDDPLLPATSTAVGSIIAPLLGYAVVSVQMRGSGCSGGDFQLFDVPTTYDGYDAVEIVAAQPWVKGGKVGLVGISFSGITQLFTAGTRPPHLAALTPLSVTDDIYTGTGFPGGIFNNGFAQSWLNERQDHARPAPDDKAQPYANALIEDGDTHCEDNQKLRLQTQNINDLIENNPFRDPDLIDDRTPANWVDDIDVPVFLVGQFHDEQTGGHFPEMLSRLSGNPDVWITLQNGVHADSLGPGIITRWAEFMDLFVAERIPAIPPLVSALSGELYKAIASGSPAAPLPATRFDDFDSVDEAREEFAKDQRVRLVFDVGGGPLGPGALEPVWELGFDAWPVASAVARTYYLGEDGALTEDVPDRGEISYVGDPAARPRKTLGGTNPGDPWAALPGYDWTPVAGGAGLGFTSDALEEDVLVVGASSLNLELRSSASDTDIQVTISDVRPDGEEMYVQSGWLRASHRALDGAQSSPTNPVQTHLEADAAELPEDEFTTMRVQIHPVAYAFRAGHKIRITVQAPGGDRPRWTFDTIEDGSIENTIRLGSSQLVLAVVPGKSAGAEMPPCPSNRGQPCRTYQVADNGG